MPEKKPKKQDDPEQSARFLETARKVEAKENPEAFDEGFSKVTRPQKKP